MADIIPAIMPKTLQDLEEHASRVLGGADVVQIDIMDGQFVKSKSWPYIKHDDYFEEIINEDRGLPLWGEIDYEIDMMVEHPLEQAEVWLKVGPSRLIAHIESFKHEEEIKKFLNLGSEFMEVALAIGIGTPISSIEPYLDQVSCIQCMGIKRIGYQGEPFDESVLQVIRDIRAKAPELPISVDGGVSIDTAPKLVEAGATRLVSGSAIFESVNPLEVIRELENIA